MSKEVGQIMKNISKVIKDSCKRSFNLKAQCRECLLDIIERTIRDNNEERIVTPIAVCDRCSIDWQKIHDAYTYKSLDIQEVRRDGSKLEVVFSPNFELKHIECIFDLGGKDD